MRVITTPPPKTYGTATITFDHDELWMISLAMEAAYDSQNWNADMKAFIKKLRLAADTAHTELS